MKSGTIATLLAAAALAVTPAAAAAEAFVPDFLVKADDYTVLMAADAKLPPGLKPFQAGAHGKFFVEGWKRPEERFAWDVTVPEAEACAVNVLLRREGDQPLTLEVTGAGQRVAGTVPASLHGWTRFSLDGTLRLSAGPQRLVLQAHAAEQTNRFNASVFSVELVRPAARERLHAAALKLRADTRWLQECRYGLMCHWTTESCPRRGEHKPYVQAVQDFDVEGIASQVQATGAGFLVLTTSHAEHFFPAPLESIDRILPGRTTRRDLVADLADALGRRGLRLILYYHLGASSDPAWLKATGFWETDTSRLFGNWTAIIGEAGRRYGQKLAGWWFDDGAISYYYRCAPWERLTVAAKAGYPGRLVAYNPWELPSPTEFQDYFCGEGHTDPSLGGLLEAGGDGHIQSGSHQGLQACATLITEGDWVHSRKDTEIGPPRWNAAQMAALLREFIARKNVPIFNLEIYQEGAFSPATVEMFRQARQIHEEVKTLGIHVDRPGHLINPTQYGVFFEEISHGGEGGLYAELVKNRSFEDNTDSIPDWKFYTTGSARGGIALDSSNLLNAAQSQSLKLELSASGTVGVANGGYWGINVVKGRTYDLSFFSKSGLPEDATLTARLQNTDGTATYATCSFAQLGHGWRKYACRMTAEATDTQGRLALEVTATRPGVLWLDVVSLFPPTWKGRPNGARPDVAELIARMKPRFIRLPGGSYVSTLPAASPRWLKQLGPIEERPGHPAPGHTNPWGYRDNDGFGFHEYLQFAEDLGAEPIYVFQGGADPNSDLAKPETYFAGAALDQLFQEILDGIEYANGDSSTKWGAKRAANGHPGPFDMKFVQIGNENWHKPFHENYIKIYNAIRQKYPQMQVVWGGDWIGNNQYGYKSDGIMPEGSAAQIVDEHYYKSDDWFYQNFERFSPRFYPRGVEREAKIFIGEASAVEDNLGAALKEAAFLLGAEKYSDKVIMAVYAPLLANANFKKWPANAIYFDSHRAYGTPSYHVQAMLGNHVGDINVGVSGLDGLLGQKLFANANLVKATGEVIIKLVNAQAQACAIRIELSGRSSPPTGGREFVLTGPSLGAGNSFEKPMNVAPVERKLEHVGNSFDYLLPAYSFSVLRLR